MKTIDGTPKHRRNHPAGAGFRWMQRGVVGAVCALVVGIYAATAHSAFYLPAKSLAADDTYYNLLVQGFRAGQLNLRKDVPPGFAQLADPYDPTANTRYGLLDLSYYKGKLYLYFGVTPAVVLFWPYVALTGQYLSQKDAALIFCVVGFLASAGLLRALWRRYFAEVSVGVVAAATLALGLAPFTPFLLARCDVYEASISCGYAFTMVALAAMWKALHEPRKRSGWLAAASLAYGLGVGARPNLLFGAVILLVPVVQAWRERLVASTRHERQRVWVVLLAATVPIILIGLGLMSYNALRFDHPLEFGFRYQLAGDRHFTEQFSSLRNLWFNLRVYFLEPGRWSSRFPFTREIAVPPLPTGYWGVETPVGGILTNIPLVWLALAVPLAWRSRSAPVRSSLCGFLAAIALVFWIGALTLSLHCSTAGRYEVDFLPALVLLAVVGIFGLERALAGQRVWRYVVRWGWSLLLGFSLAFNLLVSVKRCAESHFYLGGVLSLQGKVPEAIAQYERALRLNPDYAEAHHDLGVVLKQQGKAPEAMAQFEQALRIKPGYAQAHFDLGNVLIRQGKVPEAIAQYEEALRLKPDLAEAHNNLGLALWQTGKVPEAMVHYAQALRFEADYADPYYNMGLVWMRLGRMPEAMAQYEQALRIRPDYAEAHANLGAILAQMGRMPEAIGHLQQAERLRPDLAEAHNSLGNVLLQLGRSQEAITQYEEALRIKPDYADAKDNLASAQAMQAQSVTNRK